MLALFEELGVYRSVPLVHCRFYGVFVIVVYSQ